MKRISTLKFVLVLLLLAAWSVAGAPAVRAQSGFVLSKNADFSTDDRVFERGDVLYMRVTDARIDFSEVDKNEFRLKPDRGGSDVQGVFTNHFDGTFTASVPLAITDTSEDDWEWRARIEDDNGHAFEARVTLQVGTGNGDDDHGGHDDHGDDDHGDDDHGDDDHGDDDHHGEVEFTGTIRALSAESITVDSVTFSIDAQTAVLDHDNNAITSGDLAVGMTVEIRGDRRADGTLVATRIKIEDRVVGRIGAMGEDRLTVAGRTFTVDDRTQVLDADNLPMAFAALSVGQDVEVLSRAAAATVAARVKIVGDGSVTTAVESADRPVPDRFLLEQNYPNPFNPVTTIAFEIVAATQGSVSLVVYNALGAEVRTLVQGNLGPGRYQVSWDARNGLGHQVASGLYLYRLQVGDQVQTRTMVLLK